MEELVQFKVLLFDLCVLLCYSIYVGGEFEVELIIDVVILCIYGEFFYLCYGFKCKGFGGKKFEKLIVFVEIEGVQFVNVVVDVDSFDNLFFFDLFVFELCF